MTAVKLVKSIYTGSDVTSLGELASGDTVTIPAGSVIEGVTPTGATGTGNIVFSSALASYVTDTSLANTLDSYVSGSAAADTYQTITGMANYLLRAGGNMTGSIREAKAPINAANIDLNAANFFTRTITGAITLTVSNVPTTGTTASFILDLTNGGAGTITWWSGMKWAGGTAPTLTASGRDVLGFFTHDGGTTWTGLVLGKDVK